MTVDLPRCDVAQQVVERIETKYQYRLKTALPVVPMTADDLLPANDESRADAVAKATDHARLIRSEELFAGQKMVLIQHAGEQYRLLITRNDRLILQK